MSQHFWFLVAAFIVGGAASLAVLMNPITRQKGIGPRTIQALLVCLIGPVILAFGVEKTLKASTGNALWLSSSKPCG